MARVVDHHVSERANRNSNMGGNFKPQRDAARELQDIFDVLPEDEDYEDIVQKREKETGNIGIASNAVYYMRHRYPPRAQNAEGDPTQQAGGDFTRLSSKKFLEGEGEKTF